MFDGFKATGRTAVAQQGLGGVVQRALHLGVKLLVFQFFACNPLGRGNQRWLFLQVTRVPVAGAHCGIVVHT